MGRAKTPSPALPRPLGSEHMATLGVDDVVAALGVPHRSRAAYWRLVALGDAAVPAARAGLRHPLPAVRRGCCEFLDLFGDAASAAELQSLIDDPDADVRWMAVHALRCARCKDETWEKKAARRRREEGEPCRSRT